MFSNFCFSLFTSKRLFLCRPNAWPARLKGRPREGRENAPKVDSWLKNTPMGFYSIEYAWKRGNKPKRGEFSPDFFIKVGERVIGQYEATDSSPHMMRFEVLGEGLGDGDWVELTIEVDKQFVPALVDEGSDDIRELGLQIYWMYLGG